MSFSNERVAPRATGCLPAISSVAQGVPSPFPTERRATKCGQSTSSTRPPGGTKEMRPLQYAAAKGRDRSRNFKPRHYQKRTGIAPIIIAVAALVCLQGCSRPFSTPKPPGFQDKAEALRDWDDVAAKIASEMVRQGALRDPAQPPTKIQEWQAPYYVNAVRQPSPFLRE